MNLKYPELQTKDWLIENYINQELSIKMIQEKLGCSNSCVKYALKKHKINVRQKSIQNSLLDKEVLTKKELSFIEGCLLGDGCIYRPNDHPRGVFIYKSSEREHVEYVYKNLERFAPKNNNPVSKRLNEGRAQWVFSTPRNKIWAELHKKWYIQSAKGNLKIIPEDLKLDGISCLMWYIGDGSLSKQKSNIILCSECFSKDENIFLIKCLKDFSPQYSKLENRIKIPRKYVKGFLEYVGDCPVNCYSHKWEYREYIKKEEKGRWNKIKIIQKGKNLVKEWECIKDLAEELNINPNKLAKRTRSGKCFSYKGFLITRK